MKKALILRKLIPQTLGGIKRNVWNNLIDVPKLALNHSCLWDFIRDNKCKNILEIGLGEGKNAKKMIDLAGGCDYYCFDMLRHPEGRAAYRELKCRENVHFYIGDTKKVLPEVIGQLPKMDVIFVDGGRDYYTVKNDWEKICKPLMHDRTAVFFHDYFHRDNYSDCIGVKRVIDEMSDEFSVEIIKPRAGPHFALVKKKISSWRS